MNIYSIPMLLSTVDYDGSFALVLLLRYVAWVAPSIFPSDVGIISLSHVHVSSDHLNLRKRYRLGLRGCICLVILLLPLAGDNINSLQLIGTVCALLWGVIAVETWGNALCEHVWIGDKKKREYVCKFNIKCVQGEEQIPDDISEKRNSQEGDICFGV